MKVIDAKTTVKTSATSDVGRLTKSLKKMKMNNLTILSVFCRQVWRCILATWGVSLDRERLE